MNDSREERIDSILADAVADRLSGKTPDIDSIAREHPDLADDLRQRWSSLAQVRDPIGSLLDVGGGAESSLTSGTGGPSIEGYEILRELHRGGQGVVYQAVQKYTNRKVAIKVLLAGPFASKPARRRFEREIELVAQLKHPNIVSVFHSGQTSDDQQYCVMDYVQGVPLDQYVRNEKLTLEDALKLFAKVCEAVNYAHQKGVIHRDLKPSNILVDGDSEPKVLDFGLAKQIIGPEASQISLTGHVVGTLPYMSPEQAEGNPDEIDTRTDVYALGVILYQMLTGHYPYPVAGKIAEILKHIAETEPTPPSRSWKSESGVTKRATKRIRPGQCPIDDEVQTIVLRTLAKERQRRYQSAGELAKDVAHYLADEPIEAKRDSGWYVLKKHMRHYRLPIAIATTFVVVITVSLVVSVSLWRQAERDREAAVLAEQVQRRATAAAEEARAAEAEQRKVAEAAEQEQVLARQRAEQAGEAAKAAREETQKRADELEIVTTFQQSMLSTIDPEQMGRTLFADLREQVRKSLEAEKASPKDIESTLARFNQTLRRANATNAALTLLDEQILRRAVKTIERDFADQPRVRAALQQTVATTYCEIGRYASALPLQKAALETRRTELGDDDPDTLNSINNMGALLQSMGKLTEAEPYFREALAGHRRVLGNDHPRTLMSINNMGALLQSMGTYTEAEPYYREVLAGCRRVLGDDHPRTLTSINNMGGLLQSMGKREEAFGYYREALERRRRVLGDDHPDTLTSINNMGGLLQSMGKLAEAERYYREALAGTRRVLGNDHPKTLSSINNMGFLLSSMGKYDEAMPYYREALEGRRCVLGDDHPDTLASINNMGSLLQSMGKYAEAMPYCREALEVSRRVLGDDHPDTLGSINNMGNLLQSMGKYTEAEPYYREALARYRRVLGNNHPDTLNSINNMGFLLQSMGKLAEAEPYYREALAGYRRVLGDDHPNTLNSINNMGVLLQSMGRYTEAETYLREALAGHRRVLGDDHPNTLNSINNMGALLNSMGKYTEAEPYYREALEGYRRVLGNDHPKTLALISNMATLLESMGRHKEAEPLFREVLDARRRTRPEGDAAIGSALILLGMNLNQQQKFAEAEPLLRECLAIRRKTLPKDHWLIFNTMSVLGEALAGQGKFGEAEPLLLDSFAKLKAKAQAIPVAVRALRLRQALERIVALYESRHAAEPGKGYNAKATKAREMLARTLDHQATTTSAPTIP